MFTRPVYCLLYGDDPRRAFSVSPSPTTTISHFRDLLLTKAPSASLPPACTAADLLLYKAESLPFTDHRLRDLARRNSSFPDITEVFDVKEIENVSMNLWNVLDSENCEIDGTARLDVLVVVSTPVNRFGESEPVPRPLPPAYTLVVRDTLENIDQPSENSISSVTEQCSEPSSSVLLLEPETQTPRMVAEVIPLGPKNKQEAIPLKPETAPEVIPLKPETAPEVIADAYPVNPLPHITNPKTLPPPPQTIDQQSRSEKRDIASSNDPVDIVNVSTGTLNTPSSPVTLGQIESAAVPCTMIDVPATATLTTQSSPVTVAQIETAAVIEVPATKSQSKYRFVPARYTSMRSRTRWWLLALALVIGLVLGIYFGIHKTSSGRSSSNESGNGGGNGGSGNGNGVGTPSAARGTVIALYATTHMDAVLALALSPDGTLLYSGGGLGDKTIKQWDISTRFLRRSWTQNYAVFQMRVSFDGKHY